MARAANMVATALVAAAIATAPAADARAIAGQAGAIAAAANSPDRARRGGWGVFGSADIFQRDADLGCDPGQEEDAGLCYKACEPGYKGVGPVCWARSYGNGWGTVMKPQGCRAGYTNTGLLCSRCTGVLPWEWRCSTYAQKLACDAGLEQDGALCYPPCKAGYHSVGPVCWQNGKGTYPRGVGVPMRERYGPIKPITHQSANSGAASIFQKITEGTCESSGLAPIDDDALCTKAAAALGHAITWGPHGGYPDVPRGCTVRAQTQLFRNPAASSTQGAPCSTRNTCVCRRGKDAGETQEIKNRHGICLDASQRSSNGGKVHMWACNTGNANQQWNYNPTTGQIKNRHGICLDASQRSSNGGKVHMWACNTGNANQQWSLSLHTTSAGSPTYTQDVIATTVKALCVPENGGRVQYTGRACGDGTQIEWTSAKALDRRAGLTEAQCEWNWLTHDKRAFNGGSCGVPPKVEGASSLPTATRSTTSADGTNVQSVKDLDDAFTIVFIADLEDSFRGHTSHNSRRIVQSIADLKRFRNIKFDAHPEHVVDPELVIHGGDISKDSWKCESGLDCHLQTKEGMIGYQLDKVWGPLEEQRIPMVSALGNHDWATLKRVEGGDWLGDSKEKHIANLVSVEFARRTYKNAAKMTDELSYKEYAPQKKFGQVFINAEFKGVQIANFMEDFDTKSYEFDNNKDCTAAGSDYGLGGCTTESTGSQYDDIVRDLDRNKVTLAVVHKPISSEGKPCGEKPSEFTTAQVDKFVGMLSEFPRGAAVLSGHTHCFKETPHVAPNGREIVDYTAPYPWTHKGDADGKGGYIAMLVSPTRGILETKRINSGL